MNKNFQTILSYRSSCTKMFHIQKYIKLRYIRIMPHNKKHIEHACTHHVYAHARTHARARTHTHTHTHTQHTHTTHTDTIIHIHTCKLCVQLVRTYTKSLDGYCKQ